MAFNNFAGARLISRGYQQMAERRRSASTQAATRRTTQTTIKQNQEVNRENLNEEESLPEKEINKDE